MRVDLPLYPLLGSEGANVHNQVGQSFSSLLCYLLRMLSPLLGMKQIAGSRHVDCVNGSNFNASCFQDTAIRVVLYINILACFLCSSHLYYSISLTEICSDPILV